MTDFYQDGGNNTTTEGASRRQILRSASAGFALAASGLFLPKCLTDVEAREGSAAGQLGGRHGSNKRGRHRRRTHGDKKDNTNNKPPGAGAQIVKDVQLNVYNDGPNGISIEYWFDGNPLLGNEWHQDRSSHDLAAGATERYQSPTRSGGAWFYTGGSFQTFWVGAFNPLLGKPEISFRWGGDVQDGRGHTGGAVVEKASVSLEEGEEFKWIVQQRVTTVRRERDSDDSKIFTLRLRPTWA